MLAIAPAGIAAALAAEQVHYVLAGEVAGAVHGWRLRSTAGSFYWSQTTTPRIFKPSSERLAYSARAAESWTIPSAASTPAGDGRFQADSSSSRAWGRPEPTAIATCSGMRRPSLWVPHS